MPQQLNREKFQIIALSSSIALAEEIGSYLQATVSRAQVSRFADGEIMVRLTESVRGKNVYLVQSTSKPVSDTLIEVLIAIDACKRASAKEINVVIPYFGYSRQDRKTEPRQPITARLVANMLEVAGATRVISLELHAAQITGFFDIPVDNFSAVPILSSYFAQKQLSDIVVVSPDHGGVTRARLFAEGLNAPIAIIDKRRPKANHAEAMHLIGDVQGKNAIIIDDMVDTAGTLVSAISMLYEHGAKEVYATCVHPVLSGPAIDRIKHSRIKEFVTTNTIEIPPENKIDQIKVLSVGMMLGQIIYQIETLRPVSEVVIEYRTV